MIDYITQINLQYNHENFNLFVGVIYAFNIYIHYLQTKMMKNIIYGVGSNSNDLNRYCAYQNCQKEIIYNKLKTHTNDPSISRRMKYAQRIRSNTVSQYTKIANFADSSFTPN